MFDVEILVRLFCKVSPQNKVHFIRVDVYTQKCIKPGCQGSCKKFIVNMKKRDGPI